MTEKQLAPIDLNQHLSILNQLLADRSLTRSVLRHTALTPGQVAKATINHVTHASGLVVDRDQDPYWVNSGDQDIHAPTYWITKPIVSESVDAARLEFLFAENETLFKLLNACVDRSSQCIVLGESGSVSLAVQGAITCLLRRGLPCFNIVMASDVYELAMKEQEFGRLESQTSFDVRERTGLFGVIAGANLISDYYFDIKLIPRGTIYCLAFPGTLGRFFTHGDGVWADDGINGEGQCGPPQFQSAQSSLIKDINGVVLIERRQY